MYQYFESGKIKTSSVFQYSMAILMWAVITAVFVFIAIETNEVSVYLFSMSCSIFVGLSLIKRVQELLLFPLIEISDNYIIVNMRIGKRRVYSKNYINGGRFIKHILFFRHNNWPELIALPRIDEKSKLEILELLKNKPSLA